jgi:hypothetical protein
MLEILRADFQRLPEIVALGAPQQPDPMEPEPASDLLEPTPEFELESEAPPAPAEPHPAPQLGLF